MSDDNQAPITTVLLYYFPHWDPPDNDKEWNLCLCPAHDEDRPSCSVNFDAGAVSCKACGFKGDVLSIIRRQEGGSFAEGVEKAKNIIGEGDNGLPQQSRRKSGRRVFNGSRAQGRKHTGAGRQVPSWLRR